MNFPGRGFVSLACTCTQAAIMLLFCADVSPCLGNSLMFATTVLSSIMGFYIVGPFACENMLNCVVVLNSYSGWALVAIGVLLENMMLVAVGSLIGCSSAILARVEFSAINCNIIKIIYGDRHVTPPIHGEFEKLMRHNETKGEATCRRECR